MATKRLSGAGAVKATSKPSQPDDSRQLMRQNVLQKRMTGVKKIEHPLARYNKLDQLSCAICLILVKNEASWNAHLLSKIHKDNVEKFKRGETIVAPVPATKTAAAVRETSVAEDMEFDRSEHSNGSDQTEEPPSKLSKTTEVEAASSSSALPADFFDSGSGANVIAPNSVSSSKKVDSKVEEDSSKAAEPTSQLPEGFFDDAKRDAKARKVKYADKFEDVWNEFQKEIQKETQVSRAIVDEEDDRQFVIRDVDEIDEEIERWARVEALHNKREAHKSGAAATKMDVSTESTPSKTAAVAGENEDDSEDEDFSLDSLNWRQKKI